MEGTENSGVVILTYIKMEQREQLLPSSVNTVENDNDGYCEIA